MLVRGLLFVLLMGLAGCSDSSATVTPDGGQPDGGEPNPCEPLVGELECPPSLEDSLIVDVAWLEEHLDDPDLQLVDSRSAGYDTSRIPGAIQLRPSALATTIDGVPSMIMPPDEAEPVLGEAGLRNGSLVVVYGAPPEYDPSRIVWSLRYYQHGDVRYLDGGFAAWESAGGIVDTEPPNVEPTVYAIDGVDDSIRTTGDWVLEQLGDPPYDAVAIQLVDARSEGEYGNGRIPTARSVNWTRNLGDGLLLPGNELAQLYDGLDPAEPTVTYCVSGWRGSFAWLSLTALGYEDVKLYDGSWNEWGSGDFPVEQ
jgi:thiosulfate/3-mercaptopyruvate sulfurtransferase